MIAMIVAAAILSAPVRVSRYPEGVNSAAERSIARGLEYLARTQNRDGSWHNMGGYGSYPAAMTGLAGMALLSSGSSTTRGPYARNVRLATDYLLRVAQPNGLISSPVLEGQTMYGHGFSMLFLAEVYGMEEDAARQDRIHRVLERAIRLTARAQSAEGGWNYTPDMESDEGSVTITQVQGLRACRNAGIHVPYDTIRRAVQYLERSQNPDGGIRYRIGWGGGSRPPITAAAVAALYNAGEYESPMARKALRYCDMAVSASGRDGHYFYTHLYYAQAKYQAGGNEWNRYYREIRDRLISLQQGDGSWIGDSVGTTYGTALALTVLQLPYGHVPIYQR